MDKPATKHKKTQHKVSLTLTLCFLFGMALVAAANSAAINPGYMSSR
jgi:hypothetical protein